ncbi:hypothetical protein Ahy_A09g044364 [Arachis hypogaea]|uniref:Uncharacterized protein n=1 Tax=Arachis hypogaea TaxID=3818 RepID=A0A445BJY8_ARAHY|nr:hypothetical protein Ahy_A09g044364 [Arachis hypogaea]
MLPCPGQSFLVRQILLSVRACLLAETPWCANLVRWLCTTKCCPALAEGRAVFPKVKPRPDIALEEGRAEFLLSLILGIKLCSALEEGRAVLLLKLVSLCFPPGGQMLPCPCGGQGSVSKSEAPRSKLVGSTRYFFSLPDIALEEGRAEFLLSLILGIKLCSALEEGRAVLLLKLGYVHTAGANVVHQFFHLGSFSFLGGGSVVSQDVPKYTMVAEERAELQEVILTKILKLLVFDIIGASSRKEIGNQENCNQMKIKLLQGKKIKENSKHLPKLWPWRNFITELLFTFVSRAQISLGGNEIRSC